MYDRCHFVTGTTQLAFFAQQRGSIATLVTSEASAAKVKSYRDTNIDNANVVPTKLFKFVGMSIAWCSGSENHVNNSFDRGKIRNGGFFTFRIVDKDILHLPMIAIPELNPLIYGTGVNSAAVGLYQGIYRFPVPITLNPYENFSVSLDFDTAITVSSDQDIYVILHAFMRKLICAIMKQFIMKTLNIGGSLRRLYRGIARKFLEARNDHQGASFRDGGMIWTCKENELAEILRNGYPLN